MSSSIVEIPETRAQGAFLGLALGDAFGAPLEFICDDRVRTVPVEIAPGKFHWTDDTHMAMYLAKAITDLAPGPLDEDSMGRAVGQRFVQWLHDPLTPSTAPGNTCLRSVRRFEQSGDWRQSGDCESDGCGAVMRICPLPMAFFGEDLTKAATVSAVVTHAHPNAIEAAIAACHMLRWTLQSGHFDEELVRKATEQMRTTWNSGGIVAQSLQAAVDFSRRKSPQWLDEQAIPDGSGGWRAASALGLAVAAALAWGGDCPKAVEKAARIHGDSDSVACLTGMFLGGAGGVESLPQTWLSCLPSRQEIAHLASAVLSWAGHRRGAETQTQSC